MENIGKNYLKLSNIGKKWHLVKITALVQLCLTEIFQLSNTDSFNG
jgi:hypothetical protein